MHYMDYFIIPSRLYMFRATFSPIIRSTWLYLQYLVLFTQVAAGWCPGWVETELCRLWGVRDSCSNSGTNLSLVFTDWVKAGQQSLRCCGPIGYRTSHVNSSELDNIQCRRPPSLIGSLAVPAIVCIPHTLHVPSIARLIFYSQDEDFGLLQNCFPISQTTWCHMVRLQNHQL